MGIKTDKQVTGDIGEDIAVKFLVKHGFSVIHRNYRKKCGEIDIICTKDNLLHFIEVKTIRITDVSCETYTDVFRPEDNIHEAKLRRIGRTVEVYLEESDSDKDWKFHAIVVVLDGVRKIARIRFLQDLSL